MIDRVEIRLGRSVFRDTVGISYIDKSGDAIRESGFYLCDELFSSKKEQRATRITIQNIEKDFNKALRELLNDRRKGSVDRRKV